MSGQIHLNFNIVAHELALPFGGVFLCGNLVSEIEI